MEFGVYVPSCHHGVNLHVYSAGKPYPKGLAVTPRTIREVAIEAERLGFDALWVGDHVVFPPHTESTPRDTQLTGAYATYLDDPELRADQPIFDPIVSLIYMAAVTQRVKLATSILVVPYRNPVLTAKWLANLDVLSEGRVILGIGTGWIKEEYEALAAPYQARGAVTEEYIDLMRILWTEDAPSFHGEHYELPDGLRFLPKPIQRPIPIWGGGDTGRGMRRAARLGNGWIPSYQTFEQYEQKSAFLREALKREGRDEADFVFGHHIRLFFYDESYPEAPGGIGTAQKIADDVKRFQDLGVQHLELAPPPGPTTEIVLEQLYRFADEVMPKVK